MGLLRPSEHTRPPAAPAPSPPAAETSPDGRAGPGRPRGRRSPGPRGWGEGHGRDRRPGRSASREGGKEAAPHRGARGRGMAKSQRLCFGEGLANFGTCRNSPNASEPRRPREELYMLPPPPSTHARGLKTGCTRPDGKEGTACPAANRSFSCPPPAPRGAPSPRPVPSRPSATELPRRRRARPGPRHLPARAPTCPGGRSSWSAWCCGRCRRLCRRNPSPPPSHRVRGAAHSPLS